MTIVLKQKDKRKKLGFFLECMSIHALVLVFCCYKTWFNSFVFIIQLLTLSFFRDLHGQEIQSNSPTHTVDTGKKRQGQERESSGDCLTPHYDPWKNGSGQTGHWEQNFGDSYAKTNELGVSVLWYLDFWLDKLSMRDNLICLKHRQRLQLCEWSLRSFGSQPHKLWLCEWRGRNAKRNAS